MLKPTDHASALRLIRAIAAGATTPESALPHILRVCDAALGREGVLTRSDSGRAGARPSLMDEHEGAGA